MKAWKKTLVHVAWSSLLAGLPGIALSASAQQTATQAANGSSDPNEPPQQSVLVTNAGSASKAEEQLPDSPGTILAKASAPVTQQSSSDPRFAAPSSSGSSSSASADTQAQSTPQKPVGTAAAEAPNATGVAASQPAGVAIAPAKQHRVRTIVLRTGAIIGAGVAVGSVVALTAATPSKPPGAH
jgi:hypothetical protein